MPTAHRQDGFRFVIYPNDHSPAHVHAIHANGEAKIGLDPVQLIEVHRLSKAEARKALEIVVSRRLSMMVSWRAIHGT